MPDNEQRHIGCAVDLAPLAGTYTRLGNHIEVTTDDEGGLHVATSFELPG